MRAVFVALGLLMLTVVAPAAASHPGLLREPDVSADHIVFAYANDIWTVPREGGVASLIASPAGRERRPIFDPTGAQVAFSASYDGAADLYVVPVAGGVPRRLTHHPAGEQLTDWTADGRLVFFANGVREYPRAQELFAVAATGGLPEKLPVPYGAMGTISPDGRWLAYVPNSHDHRTWKRYRGGMASDVWIVELASGTSRRVTDWEGTDSYPMWRDNNTLIYQSDRGVGHRLNLWSFDVASGAHTQFTDHRDHDVKSPSIGPKDVVYQLGTELRLLDLAAGSSRVVEVAIPGERDTLRPQPRAVAEQIVAGASSPGGKRVLVEARGDIWSLPAKEGSPRNLTRSSGVAERSPVWSPKGDSVAWVADQGDAYDLWIAPADASAPARKLTALAAAFLYDPTFSPDGKKIALWDKLGQLHIVTVASGATQVVSTLPGHLGTEGVPLAWSADSRWLTWSQPDNLFGHGRVRLWDNTKRELHTVTSGMFDDTWPVFDRKGEFLYLASAREFSAPRYADEGTTWIYAATESLYAVPLRRDVVSPRLPKSDEEEGAKPAETEDDKPADDVADKGDKAEKGEKGDSPKADEPPKPVTIDLDGFEARMVLLPAGRGLFARLAVTAEHKLVYAALLPRGEDGPGAIKILDPTATKPDEIVKTVLSGTGNFELSADGQKLLVVEGDRWAVVDAKPDQKIEATLPTGDMVAMVDPRAEWLQIAREAWRLQRDFFYDPNMHGVEWEAIWRQYLPLFEAATTREDVNFVIGEMIAELNVGHAYIFGGDGDEAKELAVGLLGCAFEKANGAYRVAEVFRGGDWDVDGRGPLSQPGVDVVAGDYLLAVNGAPLDPNQDPWAALVGLAGKTVTLTVSKKPILDGTARTVVVETLGSEAALLLRHWVEGRRRYVEEQSGGKLGYIYVPDTGVNGQNELVRQFVGQLGKPGLVIDERWNGGGQIPTRFVELLSRPVANYWAVRGGEDWSWPPDAHQGPKAMLINGLAGSGGDYFPWWFRKAGLGKLIGRRTWGGLVGISGTPLFVDGGGTTAPTFAFYETDGTWGIEGHGVDPDIDVLDDPALMRNGGDPQLDKAIEVLLDELETKPHRRPARPAYPDRSGMGLAPADR